MSVDGDIARHYGRGGLLDRITAGLAALGVDPANASPADLDPVDEFHIGGLAATEELAARLDLPAGARVLDLGSGLGGPARRVALSAGATVEGVDLTPEFVSVATALSEMVGLADRTSFHAASALETPFSDESFDAALLIHVGMNIPDKPALMREARRVLKPGGIFAVYDVMRTGAGDLAFPVPWAETPATSFVAAPEDYRAAAVAAGFAVEAERDRRDFALDFFARQKARIAAAGGPPPLGLHLLMGETAAPKIANMIANIESGLIAPVEMILRRDG